MELGRNAVARSLKSMALVAALLVPQGAIATSIVVLRDPNKHRIIIAADCKVRLQYGTAITRCKIVEADSNCMFGMGGMYEKPFPHFDLEEMGRRACQQPGDLRKKADAFLELAREPTLRLVSYIRKNEPGYYRESILDKDVAVLIFMGLQDGHPAAFARGFTTDKLGRISTVREEILDVETSSDIGLYVGANEQILAYIDANKDWAKPGYIEIARKFVQLEITAHPEIVGPPISIAIVDTSGALRWIQRGVCSKK